MAQGLPGLDSVARSLPVCPPWGLGSSFSFQNPIVLPLLRDTGPHTSIAGLVPGGAHNRVAGVAAGCPFLRDRAGLLWPSSCHPGSGHTRPHGRTASSATSPLRRPVRQAPLPGPAGE